MTGQPEVIARIEAQIAAEGVKRRAAYRLLYPEEYGIWCQMRYRCRNPKNSNYQHYGGRGIDVCDRWHDSFVVFITDIVKSIGARPSPEYSLDRIDNDGDYEPDNVRWATWSQQALNRRNSRPAKLPRLRGYYCTEEYRQESIRLRKEARAAWGLSDDD
jgi:hypothetical protein